MVRRVRHRRSRRVGTAMGRGYKKCIISKLRAIKFKTPKAARKAFGTAAKKCRKAMAGKKTTRRRTRRVRRKAHRRVGRRTTRRRTRRRAHKRSRRY